MRIAKKLNDGKILKIVCSLKMVSLPHPVQYQGSKRNLATDILNFLPTRVERFIEPFAGTAALSIAVVSRQISQSFWLNDLNQPLIELLELMIEEPIDIINAYEDIWNGQHQDSVKHYLEVRAKFNQSNDPRLFLYLLARCVKGAVRYNSTGLFNQSADKRRKGTHPDKMRRNIEGISALLKGKCKFTSWDYREILATAKNSDFVYMDPPYQGVCGERDARYFSGIDFDDFVLAIEQLNRRSVPFAISYDGKRGDKTFGVPLPEALGLKRIDIEVGRSSQSTLLGKNEITTESLYLSSYCRKLADLKLYSIKPPRQLTLLEKHGRFSTVAR
jgi:DNA adenine methylase